MTATFLSLLCVVFVLSYTSASFRPTQRRLSTSKGWELLDQWDFKSGYVRFHYNVSFPLNYAPMKLLFYKDDQYFRVNDPSMPCEQKWSVLQSDRTNEQILNLDNGMSGCRQSFDRYMCMGSVTFNVDQGRTWYVVANRCGNRNGITGIDLRYYIDSMDEMRDPRFPMFSGQSKATFTALTIVPFLVLKQCLA